MGSLARVAILLAVATGCSSFGNSVVGGDAAPDTSVQDDTGQPDTGLGDVADADADTGAGDADTGAGDADTGAGDADAIEMDADAIEMDADVVTMDADVVEMDADADAATPDADDAADTGGGPDGDITCMTNADCTFDPARPVCDTTSRRCVPCTVADDRCPPSQHCVMNTCVDGCRTDEGCRLPGEDAGAMTRYCDRARNVCVDCLTDDHCPIGQVCSANVCTPGCSPTRACPSGLTCCASACVDVNANAANCGACGMACAVPNATAACAMGRCGIGTCREPFGNCNGRDDDGCETNTLTDLAHCGACGMACPVRPNASSTCARGACGFTCNEGFADCNGRAEDGCEVELRADSANCGRCGASCAVPGGTGTCSAGRCVLGPCATGFADCDMVASNGCEANLNTSPAHCGMCGNACPARPNAAPVCLSGRCEIACLAGFQDCNGVVADGCEVDIRTDGANCGGCGRACMPANASGRCTAGTCVLSMCNTGYADCNTNPADGCETNVLTSAGNCGACGRACPAGQVCSMGACMLACAPPQTLCSVDGRMYCANLQTEAANCGACGNACRAGERCAMGRCETVCAPPTRLCGAACVNTATSPDHCGACGNACPARANASRTCVGGACSFACNTGFGNCDGVAANGCEADLRTSVAHCGRCGARCAPANATGVCTAGACGVGACNAGFANCNGSPADGCEVDTRTDAANCGGCGRRCATGATCVASVCRPAPAGPLTVTTRTVINVDRASVTGPAGGTAVTISNTVGTFRPGQRVILHQTQAPDATAGQYEFNRVVAVSGTMVTLETPLARTYTTAPPRRAQIVAVPEYTTVTVTSSGVLDTPDWDGNTGGILAFDASGAVAVQGAITATSRGFRGPRHGCTSRADAYNCRPGTQGESHLGLGGAAITANGPGGGGGGQGQDCGAGAGGGHGVAGGNGAAGDCNEGDPLAACAPGCPAINNPGGRAGTSAGTSNLENALFMGGAGGEGGGDEDGGFPGAGGDGGGIVFIRAGSITVSTTGSITSNGSAGTTGNQFACDGAGCGMGGGGGGAGGAIRVVTTGTATIATGRVQATGAGGGFCTCRAIVGPARSSPAGPGAVGRIGIRAAAVSGTSTPAYSPL